jgi:hypothetical protein
VKVGLSINVHEKHLGLQTHAGSLIQILCTLRLLHGKQQVLLLGLENMLHWCYRRSSIVALDAVDLTSPAMMRSSRYHKDRHHPAPPCAAQRPQPHGGHRGSTTRILTIQSSLRSAAAGAPRRTPRRHLCGHLGTFQNASSHVMSCKRQATSYGKYTAIW